jgi:hypothetical protein
MYTETELREALQHSATRADPLLAAKPEPNAPSPAVELRVPVRTFQRRSWLPGVAAAGLAAAGVIAVAGGSFLLVAKPAHRSATPPQVTAPLTTAPLTAAPSRTVVAITNLITLPGAGSYLLDAGKEILLAPTGIQLMVLPAGRFDPATQLTDPHPVTVAGSHGYAGRALLDLIDPNSTQASKAGPPINTVVWQAGNRSWLVVQRASANGVDFSVPTLVRDAGQLGVQAKPAPLRSAYRAGWLPTGLSLTSADANLTKPEGALVLTAGAKAITLELTTEPFNASGPAVSSVATKRFGSYTMTVLGTGYDQAIVQRVLDNLDFSRLNRSPSTWWTFDQAVNH